jgi:3-oxoadipate enol-lactonase
VPILEPLGLYYTDQGAGPPVILLHGFALTHELWAEQAPLAEEFRLLAYDARGCGDSPAPVTGYDYPDLTAELLAFMDGLGLVKAHLVGHSRAGGILLRMALDHPERVASLVFVSSILRGFPWSDEFRLAMRDGRDVARSEGVAAAVDRIWLPSAIFGWEREQRPEVFARVERMTHRWSGAEWLDTAAYPAQELPDIERLGEVALPTYVLSGQEEMHDFVEIANMLTYWIAGARQKSLQRVGHFAMLENPYETNLYLRAFLRTVAGAG